jgi:hypothetical protein
MSLWSSIGVGYGAPSCLTCYIYCDIAPRRVCRCEGRNNGDGVTGLVCHIQKPIVGLEDNAMPNGPSPTGVVAKTVFVT